MVPGRLRILAYALFLFSSAFIFSQCSKNQTAAENPKSDGNGDIRKTSIVQAVARAMPSMVDVSAESSAMYKGKPSVAVKPGTRQYYVIQPVRGIKATRSGAGVVMDPQGFILTNAHVVKGLDKVVITFPDHKSVEGEIFGMEPKEDLAVIKINPPYPLQQIAFADSARLMVGETAIAIGNPFGLGQSVSSGIVSATKRDIVWKNSNALYRDLIQTDISLNTGNSGGPLLNIRGELIGINLAEPTGTEGISFAIPANRVKGVYEKIRAEKHSKFE